MKNGVSTDRFVLYSSFPYHLDSNFESIIGCDNTMVITPPVHAIMGKKGVLSFRNLSNLEIFFTSAPLQIIVENVIYILIIIFRACVNYNDFIVNLDFKKCICII